MIESAKRNVFRRFHLFLYAKQLQVKLEQQQEKKSRTEVKLNCSHACHKTKELRYAKLNSTLLQFAGTIWRPAALSLVYLALMFYSPMVPVPTFQTMNGHTGRYLKISICLTFLVSLTQFAFHIVLLALPPYGHFLQDCKFYYIFVTIFFQFVKEEEDWIWFFFWLQVNF